MKQLMTSVFLAASTLLFATATAKGEQFDVQVETDANIKIKRIGQDDKEHAFLNIAAGKSVSITISPSNTDQVFVIWSGGKILGTPVVIGYADGIQKFTGLKLTVASGTVTPQLKGPR